MDDPHRKSREGSGTARRTCTQSTRAGACTKVLKTWCATTMGVLRRGKRGGGAVEKHTEKPPCTAMTSAALAADAPRQVHVLRPDRDALCVDRAQLHVREQPH